MDHILPSLWARQITISPEEECLARPVWMVGYPLKIRWGIILHIWEEIPKMHQWTTTVRGMLWKQYMVGLIPLPSSRLPQLAKAKLASTYAGADQARMQHIPASLNRAVNLVQNYKAPAVAQTKSKEEHFTSEETDQIYQNILQYEKKSPFKRLLANRKTLQDEIKHPKTPTPLVLVKTRLAVVKLMIYHSMLRPEILKDGPHGSLLMRYLRHQILEILENCNTAKLTEERADLTQTFDVLYDQHPFFGWMRIQLLMWLKRILQK